MTNTEPSLLFLHHSANLLEKDFLPRIERSISGLTYEQLWWRPNASSNSIANLMLHLSGNVRQWIIAGLGGEPDTRMRDEEFNARGTLDADTLMQQLAESVRRAAEVLRSLPSSHLQEVKTIQGNPVSVLEAVYHVVEHFAMHTGQILYIAKALTDADLELYEFPGGVARKRW